MLTKLLITSVVLPFIMKGSSRGARAYEAPHLSTLLPVETVRPSEGFKTLVRSPREPSPLAGSVLDASATRHDASSKPKNASKIAATSQLYWENLDALKDASTRDFVRWLRRNEVTDAVSQRELWAFYIEFCEYVNRKPISERRLLNGIKKHGVESFRPSAKVVDGRLTRRTQYRLKAGKGKA